METDSPQVEAPVKRAPRKAKMQLEPAVGEPEPEPEPKKQRRAAPRRPKAPPPEQILPAVEVDANFMASLAGTLRTMQKTERSSKIASLKIA
jgi:hypothetical protein